MSEIHLLTYFLVVTTCEGIADCKYAVFLTQYEGGTLDILGRNISFHFLKVIPSTVA